MFGELICPINVDIYCPITNSECPNDCSEKGYCFNKKCICLKGWAGLDCSTMCTTAVYNYECL